MSTEMQTAREMRIGVLLRLPQRAFVERLIAGLQAAGFSDLRPPYMVVFQYMIPGGMRLTDLADRAQITKQSMNHLVDYLEERGYVERLPDPTDGRARLVRLTARGTALNDAAHPIARQIEADWDRLIGSGRIAELRQTLEDLIHALDLDK